MADPYVGQIMPVAFSYAPTNWLMCQGQVLAAAQYQALFSLIGGTYNQSGLPDTQFTLPDLRGRVVIGTGAMPGGPNYALADRGGANSATLTQSNIPAHTHPATFTPTVTGSGPLQASGQASLSVNASGSNWPVTVSSASVAAYAGAGQSSTPTASANALASPPNIPTIGATTQPVRIYGPATGSSTALANPVSITASASGSITGNATGSLDLAVSGARVTGGQVSIGSNNPEKPVPVSVLQPYIAINMIIAMTGLYPPHP